MQLKVLSVLLKNILVKMHFSVTVSPE